MNYRWLYFIACVILMGSCRYGYREEQPYELLIEFYSDDDIISSASSIAIIGDSSYVIGDDAPYILKQHVGPEKRIYIPGAPTGVHRIPKDTKHDYEASAVGTINENVYLLAFGSGTLSPWRDSVLFFNVKNEAEIKKASLAPLYAAILEKAKMDKKDFNI